MPLLLKIKIFPKTEHIANSTKYQCYERWKWGNNVETGRKGEHQHENARYIWKILEKIDIEPNYN